MGVDSDVDELALSPTAEPSPRPPALVAALRAVATAAASEVVEARRRQNRSGHPTSPPHRSRGSSTSAEPRSAYQPAEQVALQRRKTLPMALLTPLPQPHPGDNGSAPTSPVEAAAGRARAEAGQHELGGWSTGGAVEAAAAEHALRSARARREPFNGVAAEAAAAAAASTAAASTAAASTASATRPAPVASLQSGRRADDRRSAAAPPVRRPRSATGSADRAELGSSRRSRRGFAGKQGRQEQERCAISIVTVVQPESLPMPGAAAGPVGAAQRPTGFKTSSRRAGVRLRAEARDAASTSARSGFASSRPATAGCVRSTSTALQRGGSLPSAAAPVGAGSAARHCCSHGVSEWWYRWGGWGGGGDGRGRRRGKCARWGGGIDVGAAALPGSGSGQAGSQTDCCVAGGVA